MFLMNFVEVSIGLLIVELLKSSRVSYMRFEVIFG